MAETMIACPDGSFGAYLATPKALAPGKAAPGILVIQEIFGVNKVMRDLCDGYAAQGYVALCPDIFWRQEPGIQLTDKTEAEWKRGFELYQGFNEAKGVQDLISSLDHLRKQPACSGKAGSVGYCLGGKLAYLMATRSNADCNVSYYGGGIENLLNEASAITKPLLMHIAAEDKYQPKDEQEKIKAALGRNSGVTIHVYAGCDHAFARVGGQAWNAAAAKQANDRTAQFFKKHLA
ncbi:MAG TPA: dienelactone hydrolase family protein [Methylomirabilota bacterium]|nr:dienelactone hydrolase family protein [Methylomirabilota bacterium]